jgi:hypothetical protein
MDPVRWDERPRLRRPVLIAAFEGWNDASDAASMAARFMAGAWGATPFGAIDPDEFFDFTQQRPEVRLIDGITRQIDWPEAELSAGPLPGGDRDVLFIHGVEPHLRWRTYAATVVGIATAYNVELALTLGALLAEVPHTRPVGVTGTAATDDLVERLGLQRSRYEGPTGIVGVLHDSFNRAGIPSASLWAAVPHYVAKTPSPKAALALVLRTAELLESPVDTVELEIASAAYERQVSEVVADDDEVSAYVRTLEEAVDEEPEVVFPRDIPSADVLATEVERFLRGEDLS